MPALLRVLDGTRMQLIVVSGKPGVSSCETEFGMKHQYPRLPLKALRLKNQFLVRLFDFKGELRHVLSLARASLAASIQRAFGFTKLANKVTESGRGVTTVKKIM